MESVEFRLTTGKTEGTWTLPSSNALKDGTQKPTDYFKGSSSFFVEDNVNTIYKRTPIVFRYNDILNDPACNFIVDASNHVLIDYLKSHNLYGKFFKIHNENEINQAKSDFNDKIYDAFSIVKESNPIKLKAIAFAILGKKAIGYTPEKCAAELKETAKSTPDLIINKHNSDSYESFYMSALAFSGEIVKTSSDGNDIIWNDDRNSVILRIEKGENAIERLGDYIFENSNKAKETLQEIGLRLEKSEDSEASGTSKEDAKALSDKDKEIEALKAQLAEANKVKSINVVDPVIVSGDDKVDETLEDVQKAYKSRFGKVPANKKNDIDWLSKKLEELDQ